MAEGGRVGFEKRRGEQLALATEDAKVEVHKLTAPQYIHVLDEMCVNGWKPVTITVLRKALGWSEGTVSRVLHNNSVLFASTGDGWRATAVGREQYESWKLQVYNAKGAET